MRAAAKINKFPGGVKGNHGLSCFFFHQLALKGLIGLFVQLDSFRLGKKFALVGQVLCGKLAHLRFNLDQIFRSERFFTKKFIEKARVDGRTNAELDVGEKLSNRGGQQMSGGMTEYVQRIRIFFGKNLKLHIVIERTPQIDQFALVFSVGCRHSITGGNARHERGISEARRYFAGNFQRSSAFRHFLNFAIG